MLEKLRTRESEGRAKVLLEDMSVLREWQQRQGKCGASHAEREAMLKVATRWSVQRKLGGKHRSAADVARELEDCMIRDAECIIEPPVQAESIIEMPVPGTLQAMLGISSKNTTTRKRAAESAAQPLAKRTARSRTLDTFFGMSGRRAVEPQTEPTGLCVAAISDVGDAKRRKVHMHTTTTKLQRAPGSAAKRLSQPRARRGQYKVGTTPMNIYTMSCWKQVLDLVGFCSCECTPANLSHDRSLASVLSQTCSREWFPCERVPANVFPREGGRVEVTVEASSCSCEQLLLFNRFAHSAVPGRY